ncbi:hypothetical protein D3C72_1708340 [compost metagenome]
MPLGVVAQRAGKLQGPDQRAGHRHRGVLARAGGQDLLYAFQQALHPARGNRAHFGRLAGNLGGHGGNRASALAAPKMGFAQIGLDPGAQRAGAFGAAARHALRQTGGAILAGAIHRRRQQGVAGRKMRIEATVGQAGFLHDVRHADARIPLAPDRARSGVDDAFVGQFLAAGGGHDRGT